MRLAVDRLPPPQHKAPVRYCRNGYLCLPLAAMKRGLFLLMDSRRQTVRGLAWIWTDVWVQTLDAVSQSVCLSGPPSAFSLL